LYTALWQGANRGISGIEDMDGRFAGREDEARFDFNSGLFSHF